MQVLCISKPTREIMTDMSVKGIIEVGTEYSVTATYEDSDGLWCQLEGYPKQFGFTAKLFATLPGLTAEEMAELERESIIR